MKMKMKKEMRKSSARLETTPRLLKRLSKPKKKKYSRVGKILFQKIKKRNTR